MKLPKYELSAEELNSSFAGSKYSLLDVGEELFLADSSVKSIMIDNDNLLKQLASLVRSSGAGPNSEKIDPNDDKQASVQEADVDNGSSSSSEDDEEAQSEDYDLSLLAGLVDKTIEDYRASEARGAPTGLISDRGYTPAPPNQSSSPFQPVDWSAARLRRADDDSKALDKFRDISKEENDDRLPENQSSGAGPALPRPAGCSALIDKCESGGQCLVSDEAGSEPMRCRCPIGRGGIYCEKRELFSN